ncbi:MAG: DUF2059 domain-containing protein [Terracidiphilus sp.]|jgi:uncharacterized protein
MRRAVKFVAGIGLSLAMVPWAGFAQIPVDQLTGSTPAAVTIPADQQPTREQLAKLFELMRIKQQLAAVTQMMPALMQQQFTTTATQFRKDHPEMTSTTPEQQQAIAKVMSRFAQQAMSLYGVDEIIEDMSSLYQKHLSRSDVDGIITFYSSPAGQHMIDMTPVIMREFIPTVTQRVQERVKPLTEEMTKELMDISKPSTNQLLVAPPPPPPAPAK